MGPSPGKARLPYAHPRMIPLAAIDAWLTPAPGVPLWWYVTALCLASGIIGMGKSGFGGGIAILAVPLTASVLRADRAIGVLLPILILGDCFASAHHFRRVSRPHLAWLFVGGLLGVAVGAGVLWWLKSEGVRTLATALDVIVGGICLLLVGFQLWRLFGGKPPRIPPTRNAGYVVGAAAGVATTVAHSAGPIAGIYLLEQKLDKAKLVATAAVLFFFLNLAKLPVYVGLGLIDPATLRQSVIFAAPVGVGALLGIWSLNRIPEKPFAAIVYVTAAVAAGQMVYKAFAQ